MSTLQEMIDVMTAARDGKEIEYREKETSKWICCHRPLWDWVAYEYRVKPEPREWWIAVLKDHTGIAFTSKECANVCSERGSQVDAIVHVKEVL